MINFVSPVNHIESYLSASTVDLMIGRTKELGLKYLAVTDHGYMMSILKAYNMGQKSNVKTIAGVEIYFKDKNCDIIKNTESEKIKYFQLVVHFKDQKSYQKMIKMSSDKKDTIIINENKYPIFNWADLEELSKENVTVCTSNIECMVSKHLLVNRPDLSVKYYSKLKSIFKDNFFACIIPFEHSQYWQSFVELNINGHIVSIPSTDRVESESKTNMIAKELAEDRYNKHKILKSIYINKIKYPVNKPIKTAVLISKFTNFEQGDLQLIANKLIKALANRNNDKILLSSYSYYANKDDKMVQDMMLEDRKISQYTHMKSGDEAYEYLSTKMGMSQEDVLSIIENNNNWASLFDNFKLEYDYSLPDAGPDFEKKMIQIIKENGRMKWEDPVYVERLKHEIDVIKNNGVINLIPYFFPIRDILNHYKEKGEVTGPSRGSAGGSLLLYLMGITQLNPIKYNLPFSRFLSADRIQQGNFPDVDVDLPHRELLVGSNGQSGYLYSRWGDKAAQISTRTLLRLKSSIKDVNRYKKGSVEESIEDFTKSLPSAPQGINDKDFVFGYTDEEGNHVEGLIEKSSDLKKYIKNRPDEWEVVQKALGISRQFGRHACAFVIANKPITDIIPTFEVGGVGSITQFEAKQVEWAKLIKYDFLVVSALKDIGMTIKKINQKNGDNLVAGNFIKDGKEEYIWDLPHDDAVYDQLNNGDTVSIFQLNTVSMYPFVKKICPRSIMDMATISALVRPGPLDFIDPETGRNMAEEYIERRFGNSSCKIPIMEELLPDTYGILCFQEDITKIGKEIGKMNPIDAENLRIFMSKKRKKDLAALKPKFMEGAVTVVDQMTAEEIWNQMETFARYGFSIIHAVGYSMISYACMYLKHHYPLEWWASVLSNAEEKEIKEIFWKHVKDIVIAPDINLSSEEMIIDYTTGKIRSKLSIISGLGAKVSENIIQKRPYKDIQDFVNKNPCGMELSRKLTHVGVLDSLFESGLDLEQKMQRLEDAERIRLYNKKINEGVKAQPPKKGKIDERFLGLSPKQDFLLKKNVFPTMIMDLHRILLKDSKLKIFSDRKQPVICDETGKEFNYFSGEVLQRLDSMETNSDVYFCVSGYVIDAKEFAYKNGTKKALKILIDSSGYISEKVIWPDRETGLLSYPKDLKKGCIVHFFYHKKANSPWMSIIKTSVDSYIDN
jgi:DNA-directed DNA polymerase III PolC